MSLDQVLFDDEPLEAPWIRGHPRGEPDGPLLQVRRVYDDTFVLRQSMSVSAEAPFMYLLIGTQRALLLDTGDSKNPVDCPLRETVDHLLASRDVELVVAHSHGHYDHRRGDEQFTDRPRTQIVPIDVEGVQEFFGFTEWPSQVVEFDLGDRPLLITGAPGHDKRSIVVVDPSRQMMLSGDTLYPGRIYVQDLEALQDTFGRMIALLEDHGITRILGGHNELAVDGTDFPIKSRFHPNEHRLPLSEESLQKALSASQVASRGVVPAGEVTLWVGPCIGPRLNHVGRLARGRLRSTA
ncbi:MBL fold metallo-hydrolase [Branchiibius sp. NY16-3462-2]|uniref:MBL fold metallo-hydrolase n=1 Tax=Branchiibius sp. NY16-3462-2 TaxID=1807500 RepID=UPI000796BA9A|nr:MBL fold metallo-hydrolase [Branchiibius sp. NY16-3462-2]KYH45030.1 hypothetical protein AZH51_14165 [Branchiibius sp. NY16-3462-2]